MTIKVGIVGLGVVGQRLIHQIFKHEDFEIAALCDLNEAICMKTSESLGNIPYYTDYRELLEIGEIQLIYVAVPPAFHYEVVMAAFDHGKHVLCEKPLANSLKEAEEMLHKANEMNVVHAIHFPLPYDIPFQLLHNAVQSETIGELKRITLKMHFHEWPRPWQQTPWIGKREQGGFIREIMPHYLQMIVHLYGEMQTTTCTINYPENGVDSELEILATLTLKNGVKVMVDGLVGQAEQEHISFIVHGSNQSFAIDNWREVSVANNNEAFKNMPTDHLESNRTLLDELKKAIQNESAFLINFEEGLKVQKVLESILESGE
ncbi:Gfo/Idh/MocA family protein [Bacillus sp. FJAT-45066]|uniref:Gfo/Idh/MocA family protein n=1 Tax=Bacillus sp. FJAT-45066 TaxID=2011010 RepID=UPI000BB6944C|nr:Gfo/Idh/MocA family oxidoreductase [Bacillus sp. FJAT-45066]